MGQSLGSLDDPTASARLLQIEQVSTTTSPKSKSLSAQSIHELILIRILEENT